MCWVSAAELGARGRLHPAERERAVGALDVHPVEEQHVEVQVEVERTPKALDQRHRAGGSALGTEAGLRREMRGDAALDDAQHRTHDLGAAREEKAQGIGNAQHPLPHRLLGKDLVHSLASPAVSASAAATPASTCSSGTAPLPRTAHA